MSLVSRIKQEGFLHFAEQAFNRFVPAWLFRFSVGRILELDLARLVAPVESMGPATPSGTPRGAFAFEPITTPDDRSRLRDDRSRLRDDRSRLRDDRSRLRAVTWNSVPDETTMQDIGFAVRRRSDGVIVGGVWIGVDDFLESDLGFQIRLRSDQAWLYCAYIDKSVRGGGIYHQLLQNVASNVTDLGFRELLVMIQPWNRASMHIHRKYARRSIGHVTAIRVLWFGVILTCGRMLQSKRFTLMTIRSPQDRSKIATLHVCDPAHRAGLLDSGR